MADDQNIIKIPVKKADGTFEYKTLDEIKALKAAATKPVAPATVTPPPAPVTPPVPVQVVPPTPPPAPPAPPKPPEPPPKPTNWMEKNKPVAPPKPAPNKADGVALLDEKLLPADKLGPSTKTGSPLISLPRDAEADAIIKKLKFAVPANVLNRLRTLIQLRLKDVRSVEQTTEALLRAERDGGVGLTVDQTRALLSSLPGELTAPLEDELPSTATPFNNFKNGNAVAKPALAKIMPAPAKPPVVTPPPAQPKAPIQPAVPMTKEKVIDTFAKNTEPPMFKLNSALGPKPIIKDITMKSAPLGPNDEIRSFSLTDFRRLSGKPEEAALRLKQKFVNLRDESILLYLDAVAAWKVSPLYTEYVTTAITALAKKQRIDAPATDPKRITLPEMLAIVTMERQLDYL